MNNEPIKKKIVKYYYGLCVTAEERLIIEDQKRALGLTWSGLARKCILKETELKLLSSRNILDMLDSVGQDLGRSSQDIQQLAAWITSQTREGHLAAQAADKYNRLMQEYIRSQKSLEAAIRQIVRMALKTGG
jgi:hypothetical protein